MSPVPTNSVAPGPKSAVEMDEERKEQECRNSEIHYCTLETGYKFIFGILYIQIYLLSDLKLLWRGMRWGFFKVILSYYVSRFYISLM